MLDAEDLLGRAIGLVDLGVTERRRCLLGIVGAPATGKSTLAAWLVARLQQTRPGEVALVGMDAFHLANAVLDRRGLTEVKGAPQTFDAQGYLALLRRLRDAPGETVFAPVFHREIEESIAHEVEVSPVVRLVVTEGNYLLLDTGPWSQVTQILDQVWFLAVPEPVRVARLVARHEAYGRTREQAEERTRGSDLRNADLVRSTAGRADLVITDW